MSDNLCHGLQNDLNSSFKKFRSRKGKVSKDVENTVNKVKELETTSPNTSGTVTESINEATSNAKNSINEAQEKSQTFVGSCVDGIYNNLKDTIKNINDYVGDTMPEDIAETNALGAISKLTSSIDKLQIPDIVSEIDELLGCLSDSDCIPINEMDKYLNEVNDFLDVNGLTDTGTFDQNTFLNKKGISESVSTTLDQYKNNISNSTNEILKSAESAKDSVKSLKLPNISVDTELI